MAMDRMEVTHNPRSTAQIAGHPIHAMLVPFPIAFLLATFGADIGFRWTGNSTWAVAGLWLLGTGIVTAVLAAIFGLVDFIGDARVRAPIAWVHMLGNVTAVVVSLVSFALRWFQGAELAAGGPGLWLSVLVVLILLVTGWLGGELVYRRHVGVSDRATS